ncbi:MULTISPECIES: LysR family transcriptional regulator [Halomonadaceae]|uniref:LysR family transcriptional regulator n=1 Tax=Halomonadaceae TaxID=28256 RepID=UPI0015836146|nr:MULTISPECIES: LysR family transcriptional regulator [Halomonas]MDI4638096.1 LysR substrate-binding domain-containing protein [Halomonas sp. BMC7]NUJ59098.1 LysR family transcriptional regulator [Halomonas taeanensis]|tara:strand:- start:41501 stop:42376 length:876 start_codon:yes stop_codon:yes gene_type:complete
MLPDLKIQQLRYVLTVVDERGFHAAARHLHRTQPALSMAVKELEQRLGQRLFEKGGKAELTPFGNYCLPRFRELVTQHDRLGRDIVARVDKRAGHIDMAAVPSVASRLMPTLLADFIALYPNLKVSLHDGNADYVRGLVAAGEVDLGLTSLWQEDEEFSFEGLIRDAVGVVCRDDHPFATRTELRWQELQGQPLIRNGTSRLLDNTAAEPLLAQSAFYISNMISLTAMLVAGIGVTTLPRLAFPEEYERLRFIPLTRPHVEREIGLLKPSRRSLSPAAQAMEAFITAQLVR